MGSFDIIAFQECFTTFRKRQIARCALNQGYKYYTFGPESNWLKGKFVESGLLLISKYPIIYTNLLEFDDGSNVDQFAAKGALYAQIQVNDSILHLFSTHLQASYGNLEPNDPSVIARQKQVIQLRDWIHETNPKGTVILLGDFNVDAINHVDGSLSWEYKLMVNLIFNIDEIIYPIS